jgi:hypothetical protein
MNEPRASNTAVAVLGRDIDSISVVRLYLQFYVDLHYGFSCKYHATQSFETNELENRLCAGYPYVFKHPRTGKAASCRWAFQFNVPSEPSSGSKGRYRLLQRTVVARPLFTLQVFYILKEIMPLQPARSFGSMLASF